MAATNSVKGLIKVIRAIQFGTQSGKKRVRKTISFTDAVNGIAVGGTTNKLKATDLGFASFVETCSNVALFTTSTGALVNSYETVISPDGTYIGIVPTTLGTVGDLSISSSQSGQITVDGY